jgi:uncharacterized protein DUF4383
MVVISTARAERIAQTVVGQIVSCGALGLGVLELLRTGGARHTSDLFIFTIHPLTAVVHTALGIVGVAMVARPSTTRPYLIGAGALLVLWGLLALLLGGEPSAFFVRDAALVALHMVVGAVALVAALAVPQVRAITMPDVVAAEEEPAGEEPERERETEPEPEAGRR